MLSQTPTNARIQSRAVAELRSRKVRWWRCYVWFIWYDNEISRHHLKGGPSLKTQDKRIFGQCNVTLLTHKNVNYKVQFFLEASILALNESQGIFCLISLLGYPFVGSGLTHPALSFLSTYNIIGQGCVNIAMMLTQPWPMVIYFQPRESCYGSRYRYVSILCVLYTVYYC